MLEHLVGLAGLALIGSFVLIFQYRSHSFHKNQQEQSDYEILKQLIDNKIGILDEEIEIKLKEQNLKMTNFNKAIAEKFNDFEDQKKKIDALSMKAGFKL